MGGDPYALSRSIVGISSQRLVRKICEHCKEAYTPKDWETESLGIAGTVELFRGKGCDTCNGSGHLGRTAIYEMLELTDELRAALAKNMPVEELEDLAAKAGMTTLKQDGMAKALQGITTIDEIQRVC